MAINNLNISGNLCRDAQLRQTQNGFSVLGFSVAVNERKKNAQTGEWEQYPNYIDCSMFGTRAEKLAQYLLKGVKVSITGRIHQDRWETNEGQKRSKLGVYVDELEFMTSRNNNGAQTAAYAPQTPQAAQAPVQAAQPVPVAPQTPAAPAQAAQPVAAVPVQPAPAQPSSLYDADIPF